MEMLNSLSKKRELTFNKIGNIDDDAANMQKRS